MSVNYDREQFRTYLQDSGAVAALSGVFLKLYELKELRPKSSIKYIADHIGDDSPSLTEYEAMKDNLNAMGAVLAELKLNGKLNKTQEAAIEKLLTVSDKSVTDKRTVGPVIEARQSQLLLPGNEIKKSNKNDSQIRKIPNNSNYDKKIKEAINAVVNDAVCNSLLKNCLKTKSKLYDTYKAKQTEKDFVACIASGLDIHQSMIGVYAAVNDAYDNFSDLFDPIICEYHDFDKTKPHPALDWGDPKVFTDIDQKSTYIISTRIRCVRNVSGYSLVPKMDKNGLQKLSQEIKQAFDSAFTAGDLKGTWYDQANLNNETKKELIENGYILEFGDKFLESAGATKSWPDGRALWINDQKTFFVWINEEDHLRFISMEFGSNFTKIYERLIEAVNLLEKKLTFQTHTDFGFVTLCPTNLGNTIRASVMVTLPKLSSNLSKLETIVKKRNLEVRGSAGPNDTFEISNKRKLGLTEHDSVNELYEGLEEILKEEENS